MTDEILQKQEYWENMVKPLGAFTGCRANMWPSCDSYFVGGLALGMFTHRLRDS